MVDSFPSSSSGNLRILLLGPPAVIQNDQPYPIQRRLLRSILFYLAAQGRPVNRSELLNVFWPEDGEDESRAKLRVALSKLRTELPDPNLLQTHLDQVTLNFERIYVDALEFQALYDESGRALQLHAGTPLPEATYQQLLKAYRLWRAPRFMVGANLPSTPELDNWLIATAQSYEYSFLNVLMHLVEHLSLIGDIDLALGAMLFVADMEPFNEEHHVRILNWMRDLDRRSEALKYYDKVCRFYEKEGMDLPTVLADLGRSLQNEPTSPPSNQQILWSSATSLQVPFVGRQAELQRLRAAFLRGGVTVIAGEAGSGKSRLVAELYQSLVPVPRLMLAIGRSQESNLMFQPLVDMMRHSIQVDEWNRLDLVWARTLSTVLPELPSLRPDVIPPDAGSVPHTTLYEAFRQLLLVTASHRRLLFFLDDAQWCDEVTLEAFSYLLERDFFKDHGLLVVAARIEKTTARLEPYFARSRQAALMEKTNLQPLSVEEIRELAHFAMSIVPSDSLVRRLQLDTGGNPLFLLETLRALLDLDRSSNLDRWAEHLPLASSIHALVRERLHLLSTQAHQTLVTAAVIGHDFSMEVLRAASSIELEPLVSALEELERSHLIAPTDHDGSQGDFAFIHDKLREVLLLELSEARKRMLHQRVARAIEQYGGSLSTQAETLARHYEIAGDPAAALSYWLTHARSAVNRLEFSAGLEAYQRAENMLFRVDRDLPDDTIYRLYKGWANLAQDSEDIDTMERSYSAMLRQGEERRSSLLMGSGMSGMAMAQAFRSRPARGVSQLERSLPYIRQSYHLAEQIDAQNRLGYFQIKLLQMHEAEQTLLQALEMGQTAVDEVSWEARVGTEGLLARLYNMTGYPLKAYNYAHQSLTHAYRLHRTMPSAYAQLMLAQACLTSGRYEEAIDFSTAALEIVSAIPARRAVASLKVVLARAYGSIGHLDQSWSLAQSALQIARERSSSNIASQAHCAMGELLRAVRDYNGAIEQYRLGISEAVDRMPVMENQYRLGLTLSMTGQAHAGMELVNQVLSFGQESGMEQIALEGQMELAVLLFHRGDIDRAIVQADLVGKQADERGLVNLRIWNEWIHCQAALLNGDVSNAQIYAKRLMDISDSSHNVWSELGALDLSMQIARQLEEPLDPIRARIEQIMAQIQVHSRSVDLRARYEQFARALLASVSEN